MSQLPVLSFLWIKVYVKCINVCIDILKEGGCEVVWMEVFWGPTEDKHVSELRNLWAIGPGKLMFLETETFHFPFLRSFP